MKISTVSHNNWMVFSCEHCGHRVYSQGKMNKQTDCLCGSKDMDIVVVDEWVAADFLQVCGRELKKNGHEAFVDSLDSLYEKLKPVIATEQSFASVMKAVTDEVFKLIDE
jgi:hypothetical protein